MVTPKFLRISVALLALGAAIAAAATFLNGAYDLDLDHEIYFGQRLLAGELIWTRGFHDKFPFVQLVFALPAAFADSVTAFRLLSLVSVVGAGVAIGWLLPRIVDLSALAPVELRLLKAFALLVFFNISALQVGGLSTIDPLAASAALVAALFIFATLWTPGFTGAGLALAVVGGAAFACAGISIRPYYFAPLAVTFLISYVSGTVRRGPLRTLPTTAGWVAMAVFWWLAMNLLPYTLIGNLQAFRDGVMTLAANLDPRPFLESLAGAVMQPRAIYTILVWLTALSLTVLQVGQAWRVRRAAPLIGLAWISAVSLLAFIATKHFWSHYFNLFSGFAALILVVPVAASQARTAALGALPSRADRLSNALVVSFAGLTLLASVASAYTGIGRPHREASQLASFEAYLAETGQKGVNFLAPKSMYFQWKLHSSIGVFPHSANTSHICRGWWRDLAPVASFPLPTTKDAYCALMQDQGPALVVDRPTTGGGFPCDLDACLRAGPYKLDRQIDVPDGTVLNVYRRQN